MGAKLGAKMVPKVELLDFQIIIFFHVLFNGNDLLEGVKTEPFWVLVMSNA